MNLEEFKIKILPAKNKMFRIAKRLLNSKEEAEDAVQEALIKLWQKKDEISDLKSPEALAITFVKNLSIDKLRKRKINKIQLIENMIETKSQNPETELESKETFERINAIIQQLPEKQRMIIQLKDIEGYSTEEISGMLEIEIVNVRVILSRARKQIRKSLININRYHYE